MRKGWEIKCLGELVSIRTGKLDANAMAIGGQYPFFTCSKEIFSIDKYAFDCEAILLAGNNASGDFNVKHYKGKFNAYQRTYVITIKDDSKVLYKYLTHCLKDYLKVFKEQSVGTNTKFLKLGMIKDVPISLPPLSEQKRIIAILDSAFAAIDKAKANIEKNLENARELFVSYLEKVFANPGKTWERKVLGEVCVFKGGGTPSTKVKRYWEGNIPWVSPKDIKSKIVSDSQDRVTEEAITKSATCLIPDGSILVVVRSGILARIVPIGISGKELTINQDLKALCPIKSINSNFLYYLLQSKMDYLLAKVTRGATVHRLTTDALRELSISFPSLNDQKSIVKSIDLVFGKTQKLSTAYQRKLSDLEELKKSILQKAFSGQLTRSNYALEKHALLMAAEPEKVYRRTTKVV